jgi:hypothetical protein
VIQRWARDSRSPARTSPSWNTIGPREASYCFEPGDLTHSFRKAVATPIDDEDRVVKIPADNLLGATTTCPCKPTQSGTPSLRAHAPVSSRLEVLERRGDGLKIAQALRRPGGQPRENAPVSQSAPNSFHRRATETR